MHWIIAKTRQKRAVVALLGLTIVIVVGGAIAALGSSGAEEKWEFHTPQVETLIRRADHAESVSCRVVLRNSTVHRWRCKVTETPARKGLLVIWIKRDGSVSSRGLGVKAFTLQGE
jgi:hypothetical protein